MTSIFWLLRKSFMAVCLISFMPAFVYAQKFSHPEGVIFNRIAQLNLVSNALNSPLFQIGCTPHLWVPLSVQLGSPSFEGTWNKMEPRKPTTNWKKKEGVVYNCDGWRCYR